MKYEAYWISYDGTIFPVEDRHIAAVARDPERFGLTEAKIRAVYRKYGEKVPVEANARQEIMAGLIKKGWIRIRYRRREDSFTVQIFKFDAGAKRRLKKWAAEITGKSDRVPLCTGCDVLDIRTGEKRFEGTLKSLSAE